jgi:hypothetical protein
VWRHFSSLRQAREAAVPVIDQQPVAFSTRTFDPANPPPDMPPLAPGEEAVCDSIFLSHANVTGEAEPTDATHALVTVTHVQVTLQLNVTIWVPANASAHVIEHENGHRQISEHYYQMAPELARRIAAAAETQQVLISGSDLQGELSKTLQQLGDQITEEYNKELDPEPAQLRYDTITDHSRNDVAVDDAIAQALRETGAGSSSPPDPAN